MAPLLYKLVFVATPSLFLLLRATCYKTLAAVPQARCFSGFRKLYIPEASDFFFGARFPREWALQASQPLHSRCITQGVRKEIRDGGKDVLLNMLQPLLLGIIPRLHLRPKRRVQVLDRHPPPGVVRRERGAPQPLAEDLVAETEAVGVVDCREDLALRL